MHQQPQAQSRQAQAPHSANLRLHRRMHGPGIYFITKCLQPKTPRLSPPQCGSQSPDGDPATPPAHIIAQALLHYHQHDKLHLAAFVVMPDHWHALFGIPPEGSLPTLMSTLNSWIAKRTLPYLQPHGVAWQDSYYDTRIRTSRQFQYICTYIEANPCRAGLSQTPDAWQWSSASPDYSTRILRPWPWPIEDENY